MFGYYKINNLCIGEMRIVVNGGSISTNKFLILEKLNNESLFNLDFKNSFKEIFTKTKFKTIRFGYYNELIVGEIIPLCAICNKKEG